jgi:hypothetical protein
MNPGPPEETNGMSEPNQVIRDVVAELAQQQPKEFAGFWAMLPDQQSELIERYGTASDRELWRERNAGPSPDGNA